MSYTVTPRWSDQRLTRAANAGWTATLGWNVSGSVSEMLDDAGVTSAVPMAVGFGHPANPLALLCKSISAEPGLSMRVVRAQFDMSVNSDSPLNEPPEFDPQPITISAPIDQDADGNPIVSTSGFPLPFTISEDTNALQIGVTINMPYFDAVGAIAAQGKTNIGPKTFPGIGMIDTGQGYIKSIRPMRPFKLGASFVRVQFSIICKQDGWKKKVPSKGTLGWFATQADGGGGTVTTTVSPGPFCTPKGVIITDPQLLGPDGRPIVDTVKVFDGSKAQDAKSNPGYVPSDLTPSANLCIINFKVKGTYDFNNLPF